MYYNRNARDLRPLSIGDQVIFWRLGNVWSTGVILTTKSQNSYIVKDTKGVTFHRNRKFIKKRDVYTIINNHVNKPAEEVNVNESLASKEGSIFYDAEDNTEVRTRSGRAVKTPGYLKDFVTN